MWWNRITVAYTSTASTSRDWRATSNLSMSIMRSSLGYSGWMRSLMRLSVMSLRCQGRVRRDNVHGGGVIGLCLVLYGRTVRCVHKFGSHPLFRISWQVPPYSEPPSNGLVSLAFLIGSACSVFSPFTSPIPWKAVSLLPLNCHSEILLSTLKFNPRRHFNQRSYFVWRFWTSFAWGWLWHQRHLTHSDSLNDTTPQTLHQIVV